MFNLQMRNVRNFIMLFKKTVMVQLDGKWGALEKDP